MRQPIALSRFSLLVAPFIVPACSAPPAPVYNVNCYRTTEEGPTTITCENNSDDHSGTPDGSGGSPALLTGECVKNADCPPTGLCESQTCVASTCVTEEKKDGSPCLGFAPNMICDDGDCVPGECSTPDDCGAAPVCKAFKCVDSTCLEQKQADGASCLGGAGACLDGACK